MNSRERFQCAMAHQKPDRVPFDIGGTSLTGMRPAVEKRLREILGFSTQAERRHNGIDDRILRWAGTDFRSVGSIVDLPSDHTRRISPKERMDCWGIRREFVDGQWQITQNPLRGASIDEIRAYDWPEPEVDDGELARWEEEARQLREENRYVVVGQHPVFGILELGCWMCGYDDLLLRMVADPDAVRVLFEKFLEIQIAVIEQYYPVLGPYIDLTTSGDDFGSQQGPLISPATFESLIAPYFSERIGRTKDIAGCYYWHHTCGSVAALLDQIIDCGVDILNPIQTFAAQMEPASLKERFGDRIVFWGGVDVQQFLPRARREEVPDHIRQLLETLGEDGGYVMAPAHEIQDDVRAENIVTWVETV